MVLGQAGIGGAGAEVAVDRSVPADGAHLPLEALEIVGRSLDMRITADNCTSSFVETSSASGVNWQGGGTVSGLSDGDYGGAGLAVGPGARLPTTLRTQAKVPLPPELLEHFAHMQCHCMMGLFPEISRAWLTVDSDLYLWAYERGSDVAYYDGLSEIIVSVGLVKPKPQVFHNFVKYLLVLTTTVEIVVLGVTFSNGEEEASGGSTLPELHLVAEPVFVLPTDGVSMNVIQPTDDGRIFMGGKDGCLYEIVYQAQLGWFGKHCRKVNHSVGALSFLVPSFVSAALQEEDGIRKACVDSSRDILFTLSEHGALQAYDIAGGVTRVARLTQAKVARAAADIVKTLESTNFRPIIAISPIEDSESQQLNLVAITQTGVRLYFTTGCTGRAPGCPRPRCLALLHVRLPPGFAANAPAVRPDRLHAATYEHGTAMLISASAADGELLWCLSGRGGAAAEDAALLELDGPAWALARTRPPPSPLSPALRPRGPPGPAGQHWAGPVKWAVLTGSGAHLLQQLRPADVLRQLLLDARGADSLQLRKFFQSQRVEQACACCLVLACAPGPPDPTAEWAAQAFFLLGARSTPSPAPALAPAPAPSADTSIRSPQMYPHVETGFPQFAPQQMSTPVSGRSAAAVHRSLQAALQSPTAPASAPDPGSSFSAEHEGLYLYVGRILRPIWNMKCVTESTVDNKQLLSSTITGSDCSAILQYLYGVKSFLERWGAGGVVCGGAGASPTSDVVARERQSLEALRMFINGSCEMLSLWKIVCEHQFHVLAGCLPLPQHQALLQASFRELLLGGQEVASLLIQSLINQYLADNASVDSISAELREVCPSLYRKEDAACSKANELLLSASSMSAGVSRDEALERALQLCVSVSAHVQLGVVCSKLRAAACPRAVLQLAAARATALDPDNAALHFYRNRQPAHDREGYMAFYKRMDVYREVTLTLEQLIERQDPEEAGVEAPDLSAADANRQARELVRQCLLQSDELLHIAVYEWLLNKRLHGQLVALADVAPSLESFLVRTAQNNPDAALVHDLLWKYYERTGNHAAAARVLEQLASKPGAHMPLSQRVAWLSRGVVLLRGGAGASPAAGRLLREMEEKAEVARLQARVLAAARACPNTPATLLRALDQSLLTVTQLYEDCAERLQLYDCQLAILHCSGHDDPLLVESIWNNIIRGGNDPPERDSRENLKRLLTHVSQLAAEYQGTGHCFPLGFIVKQLELVSCGAGEDAAVSRALLDAGVPLEQLIHTYSRLIGLNERVWLSAGNELHPARAAAALLEMIASRAPPRRLLAPAHDLLAAALGALYAKPDTDTLVSRLKGLQATFERME